MKNTDSLRLVGVLGLLVAIFGFATDSFLSPRTFLIIANQIPALLVVSVGMTFVVLIGGIDLSVGSLVGLGGAVLGTLSIRGSFPLPVAMGATLLCGLLLGAANATVMLRWRVPSFIVTLGMLEIARGGAYLVTGSKTQYIGAGIEPLADPWLLGLSPSFAIAILIVAFAHGLLTLTVFGRKVIATGTNEEAVRLAGIDTRRIKLAVFAASGLLAAVASVMHAARLGAADPNAGTGFELQAIAAVVVGGASLMGGRGSVARSVLGVVIIAVLDAGLAQAGAQEPAKRLITGAVIVVAVVVDNIRQRRGVQR